MGKQKHNRLVGRSAQCDTLRQAIDAAASGQGRVILIEGGPGIGKTRLMEEALVLGDEAGFHSGIGRCHDHDLDRPLGPLLDALISSVASRGESPAVHGLEQELSALTESSPTPAPFAPARIIPIIDRIVEAAEAASTEGPVILAIDDLQWADAATIRAVEAIANRVDGFSVVLIAAFRPPTAQIRHRHLVEFRRRTSPETIHLDLVGLELASALELAAQLIDGRPGARLQRMLAGTGGNPLFVVELLTSLLKTGSISRMSGVAEAAVEVPDQTFDRVVLDTFRSFGADVFDLVTLAAVLGVEFEPRDLVELSGEPVTDVFKLLRPLLDDGWLVEQGAALRFRHDLVRDAVYFDVPEGFRLGLHHAAATALRDRRAPAPMVAAHLEAGSTIGDPEAIETLVEAGKVLAIANPLAAVSYLELALDLDPGTRSVEIQRHLSQAHVWGGDIDTASVVFETLLAQELDPATRLEIEENYAEALLLHGRTNEAVQAFEHLVSSSSCSNPGLRRADLALCHIMSGHVDEALAEANRAAIACEAEPSPRGECGLLNVTSLAASLRGDHLEAIRVAEMAVARANASSALEGHREVPYMFLSQVNSFADRHAESLAALDAGMAIGRQLNMAWDQALFSATRATELLLAGLWDDASAEASAVLAFSVETGVRVVDAYAHACLSHVARRRGDLEAAQRHVTEGAAAINNASQGADLVLFEQAMLGFHLGRSDDAIGLGSMVFGGVTDLGIFVRQRQFGPELANLCEEAGRPDVARSIRYRLADLCKLPSASPGERAAGLIARGQLEHDHRPMAEAIDLLTDVRRTPELAGAHAALAVALCDQRGSRSEQRARAAAETATQLFDGLGAVEDLQRLRRRLETSGLQPKRNRPKKPSFGWDSLTESEERVVAGVAAGKSNAQIATDLFVSRRTVESHLHHVYTKLGTSSRTQLATEALQRP